MNRLNTAPLLTMTNEIAKSRKLALNAILRASREASNLQTLSDAIEFIIAEQGSIEADIIDRT